MLRRLMGLLMILVLIAPILFGVFTVVTARQIFDQVGAAVDTSRVRVEAEIANMEEAVNTATRGLNRVGATVTSVTNAVNSATQSITSALNNLNVTIPAFRWPSFLAWLNLPDIPAFTFQVPGIAQIRGFLLDAYSQLGQVVSALGEITALRDIPPALDRLYEELAGFYSALSAIAGQWAGTIQVLLIGFVIWVGAVYLVVVYRWLTAGWKMLTGQPT